MLVRKLTAGERRRTSRRIRLLCKRALVRRKRKSKRPPPPRTDNEIDLNSGLTGEVSEDQLKASILRDSFFDFVKFFWSTIWADKPVWNWHIKYLCDQMSRIAQRVARGEPKEYDLCVNISPGTTKSTIISIMFPAWVWTFMPHAVFICCSHGEKLGLRLSMKCRAVVQSDKYKRLFGVELSPEQNAKGFFANTSMGERYAVGSGSSYAMGNHAHFILIDDPIDPESVLSEAELDRVNNWIDEQLSGRKKDKAVTVTVLVMQRLHQDDPTAKMLKMPRVKHVCLPATDEFEIKPPGLKRYYATVDESRPALMDPKRLSHEVLADVKARPDGRGDMIYSGQYGQVPTPPGGGDFKVDRLKWGTPPSKFKALVRFWDKAATVGRRSAYTTGVLMGKDSYGRLWILDVKRVRMDTFERERLIRQTAREDGHHVIVGVEQEPGSGGIESAQNTVRRLIGYKVKVLKVTRSKEERSVPFSTQVNAGNVYLPSDQRQSGKWTGWSTDYVDELRYFPVSSFKDQVDATSGGLTVISRGRRGVGGMSRSAEFSL